MKIMVSAGEVSGDIHGSYLVKELKNIDPSIYFLGMGSDRLRDAGVDIKVDIAKHGTIGIFEALPNLFPIYFSFKKLVALLKKEKPDILILIDSQGINMPLAKAAKKLGIRTVYYIAPQEWLWGTKKGIDSVADNIDLIIAIFEKEFNLYKSAGGHVVYFGHPLIDIVNTSMTKEETINKYFGNSFNKLIISLCPGSRTHEIKNLFPILLRSAGKLKESVPNLEFIIPAASAYIKGLLEASTSYQIVAGDTYNILSASNLALCASGTINFEASILGTPNMMIYKLSPLTYFIGKYILKIGEKLPYFSMPNLLLNEKIIPELIMKNANPKEIAKTAKEILFSAEVQDNMRRSFNKLKSLLGSHGVISRAAQAILSLP